MEKLYIIPALGETTKESGYQSIVKDAKKKSYEVVPVDIDWNYSLISEFIEQFRSIVQSKGEDATVLGFSFGAYIAAVVSREFNFKKIIFCSLSPYFKEDLDKLPEAIFERWGNERKKDFSQYSFPGDVKIPAVFLVGDKDWDVLVDRVKRAYNSWTGLKEIKFIEDAGHDFSDQNYIETVKNYI